MIHLPSIQRRENLTINKFEYHPPSMVNIGDHQFESPRFLDVPETTEKERPPRRQFFQEQAWPCIS